MKKNIKKQTNKKTIPSAKKKKSVLSKPKKTTSKRIVLVKKKKHSTIKTKAAFKKNTKVVLKSKLKKNIRKSIKGLVISDNSVLSFGDINPQHGKFLLLIIAIIIVCSVLVAQSMKKVEEKFENSIVAENKITRNIVREKELNKMVEGYPISKMTTYIAKQDPKVAAFLIAIAKKESSWGEKRPVLDGEDCYNYWGFRLKSDRMGSGGHTCFDSPKEAVAIVGARIDHLVNDEKIDTPREMVIWKCGYACNGPEAAGSEKWIKDVDYYYKQLIN